MMGEFVEPWLIPQLRRLAKSRPERFASLVATLREARPDLYEELSLLAVEHGEIDTHECAVVLGTDPVSVGVRLEVYRREAHELGDPILVELDELGVARLAGAGASVWEIVREHRKLGSIGALKDAYPALSESELRAALRYSERHEEEIEETIRAYEARFVGVDRR